MSACALPASRSSKQRTAWDGVRHRSPGLVGAPLVGALYLATLRPRRKRNVSYPAAQLPTLERPSHPGDLVSPHGHGRAFFVPNPPEYQIHIISECAYAQLGI